MELLEKCPVCLKSDSEIHIKLKDHFLTKESFNIVKCNSCGFLYTNPRPEENEILKYYKSAEYLSHSKQKVSITSIVYNLVKNYSLKAKHKTIIKYKAKGSILDVGCATGEFLNYLQSKGWHTTGIEPTPEPREFAKQQFNLNVLDTSDFERLSTDYFDVVTMWHVLEHIHRIDYQLDQVLRVIKPDGTLLIALPNHLSWDAERYKEHWAAYDVPRHLYHFSPATFKKLITRLNLIVDDIIPMKFDSFYVSLLSEQYQESGSKYLNAVFNGLRSNSHAKKSSGNYSSLIYILRKK